MRLLVVLPLTALLLVASCSSDSDSDSDDVAAPTPSATATASSSSAPSASPSASPSATTLSETEKDDVACQLQQMNTGLIANSWARARASAGAADHDEQLEDFAEEAADLTEEAGDRGCAGAVEASALSLAAATLRAQVLATGTATDADYQTVAEAGNAYVAAVGDDASFTS